MTIVTHCIAFTVGGFCGMTLMALLVASRDAEDAHEAGRVEE